MASLDTVQSVLVLAGCLSFLQPTDTASDFGSLDLGFNDADGDDFLETIGSMVDSFADALGKNKKGCTFRCPSGGVAKPREDHIPRSNGCGSFGIQLDTTELPQMTTCCDRHDFCYDTCNTDKASCDRIFKKCLEDMCEKMDEGLTQKEYEGCLATAELMYQGTETLGCTSFLQGQKEACECIPKTIHSSQKDDKFKTQHTPSKENTRKAGEL